jgi:hypothetical protein
MFGYLRFLLSHLNIKYYKLNLGVVAVVLFYILAILLISLCISIIGILFEKCD